jgi:hypothetical protein
MQHFVRGALLTRWCRPRGPVLPMYMPGRLRTGSKPSNTCVVFHVSSDMQHRLWGWWKSGEHFKRQRDS